MPKQTRIFTALVTALVLIFLSGCGASNSLTPDAVGTKNPNVFSTPANGSGTQVNLPTPEDTQISEPPVEPQNPTPNEGEKPVDTNAKIEPPKPTETNAQTSVNGTTPPANSEPEIVVNTASGPTVIPAAPDVPAQPIPPTEFTSNLIRQIMETKTPVNALPFWYGYRWNRGVHQYLDMWTESLYKEIDQNAPAMTGEAPQDIQRYCPKYSELDREKKVMFWVRLVSILASMESGYKTTAVHQEPASVGENVLSSGLLQLSIDSALQKQYKCDSITRGDRAKGQADLLDPQRNMACAIRIMNYYLESDKVISGRGVNEKGEPMWKGLPRYWAPFRHPRFKTDMDVMLQEAADRVPKWQADSRSRDKQMAEKFESYRAGGKTWLLQDWEFLHPSLFESEFSKQETHFFTSILRLTNQTSFCF